MGLRVDALVNLRRSVRELRVSPLRVEELDAVMEIERASFPEPWSPGLFLHELRLPFSKTLVVREAGSDEILGYACRWLIGDEVHILNLAVRAAARRQGIARELVGRIVAEADAEGVHMITLEVRRENAAAIALYRGFGFVACGVRRNYYARGIDAIIMSRARGEVASTSPPPVKSA